jgi:hypothetical protein
MPVTATLRLQSARTAITAMPLMPARLMGTMALIGSLAASLSVPAHGSVAAMGATAFTVAAMGADVASTAVADTTAVVAASMDAAGMALMVVAPLAVAQLAAVSQAVDHEVDSQPTVAVVPTAAAVVPTAAVDTAKQQHPSSAGNRTAGSNRCQPFLHFSRDLVFLHADAFIRRLRKLL